MSELKGKRSEIWKHFTIVGTGKAKCSYCNKILSFGGGATGNLARHIKSVHKAVGIQKVSYGNCGRYKISTEEEEDRPQEVRKKTNLDIPSPSTSFASTSTIPQNAITTDIPEVPLPRIGCSKNQEMITNFIRRPISLAKSKQLDEQLLRVIVKEYQPFKVVENPEFKKFVTMLCPGYQMPDRKTISNSLIPKIYNSTKETIFKQLSDVDAVCLTTDGWTSINNQSFISITAHFIDHSDKQKSCLNSFLLGCIPFDERHTAKNLSDLLQAQAQEWGLTNKIACVVSDNAANITAAIRLTPWRFIPCFAHTLNLVLQAGLAEIKEEVDKVKTIVQFFKRSSSALAKLRGMQAQMGLPELKLKQDVVTRWNSTYDMISRFITIKNAIVGLLAIDEPQLNTLLPSDWTVLEESIEILRLFHEITEEISAEKSVTVSKIILFVNSMNIHLHKMLNRENSPKVTALLKKLQEGIRVRFKDVETMELTSQATFLDPRFKKYGFSSIINYENTLKGIKSKIAHFNVNNSTAPLETMPIASTPSENKKTSVWDEFDDSVKNVLMVENPMAASIVEIDKYLNEPLIRRTEDPLQWWEERKLLYPRLYKLMRRRLCIVATSVPCECIFSHAGEVITEKRSRLKPEKASQVLFLNHNL